MMILRITYDVMSPFTSTVALDNISTFPWCNYGIQHLVHVV